jgi:hypothetical protein
VAEQKADQQLRGGQKQQHKSGHGAGVGQCVLGEQLAQAGRAGQQGHAATVAQGRQLRADQQGFAQPGIVRQRLPAAGVGLTQGAGQAFAILQRVQLREGR